MLTWNGDFKTKNVTRNRGKFIVIKGFIPQKDRTITNAYAPTDKASIHKMQKLYRMRGEIDNSPL